MKKLLIAFILASVLLLGCTQQTPSGGNTSTGSSSGGATGSSSSSSSGGAPSGSSSSSSGGTVTPPASAFANYDLSVAGITLNVSQPEVSFFTAVSADVKYDGRQKPSRYKVTLYDNGNIADTKTVNSPGPDETVTFNNWFAATDEMHNLTAVVQTFEDEKAKEDGPSSNNMFEKDVSVASIGLAAGTDSKEFSSRFYRAQQFLVQNKIGIGTISIDLKADQPIGDVPLVIELRDDSGDKPAGVIRTTTLTAKYLGTPQSYTVSYGKDGVYLTKSKYWIVVYLGDTSENTPAWMSATAPYAGKSATLDKSSGYGNIWTPDTGAFAFKVSTIPQ